jgi:hydrogenase maturation protease
MRRLWGTPGAFFQYWLKINLVKTLVVGLGNPILGDDGVGWQIASELQNIESIPSDVTIECMAIGGISLMESLIGYDRAIIIDAIVTHTAPIGSVKYFKLGELPNPSSGHMSSAHDTSLQDALHLGRDLGAYLPDDITVVTVESQKVYDFSETLTPPVANAVPEALKIIRHLLLQSYPAESQQLDGQSI